MSSIIVNSENFILADGVTYEVIIDNVYPEEYHVQVLRDDRTENFSHIYHGSDPPAVSAQRTDRGSIFLYVGSHLLATLREGEEPPSPHRQYKGWDINKWDIHKPEYRPPTFHYTMDAQGNVTRVD